MTLYLLFHEYSFDIPIQMYYLIFIVFSIIYLILLFLYHYYYYLFDILLIILLGFRYSASSTPIISSVGVAIGAGSTPSMSIFSICRNPIIPNVLIRRALIGSPPVEVSGSIGTVYSFLVLYALFLLILLFL